jgi:hypothetical protein
MALGISMTGIAQAWPPVKLESIVPGGALDQWSALQSAL